jgi:hypothetical protein
MHASAAQRPNRALAPFTHRGIDLEVPIPYTSKTRFDDTRHITRVDRLGGLLHEYSTAA